MGELGTLLGLRSETTHSSSPHTQNNMALVSGWETGQHKQAQQNQTMALTENVANSRPESILKGMTLKQCISDCHCYSHFIPIRNITI
jgi:hypothetical protein